MIPLTHGEMAPFYQQEAITWLKHFKHTDLLQELLSRFEFSEAEIAAYRRSWTDWLKPIARGPQ